MEVYNLYDQEDVVVRKEFVEAGFQAAVQAGATAYRLDDSIHVSNRDDHHGFDAGSVNIIRRWLLPKVNR
jgi:hypothetical protein